MEDLLHHSSQQLHHSLGKSSCWLYVPPWVLSAPALLIPEPLQYSNSEGNRPHQREAKYLTVNIDVFHIHADL